MKISFHTYQNPVFYWKSESKTPISPNSYTYFAITKYVYGRNEVRISSTPNTYINWAISLIPDYTIKEKSKSGLHFSEYSEYPITNKAIFSAKPKLHTPLPEFRDFNCHNCHQPHKQLTIKLLSVTIQQFQLPPIVTQLSPISTQSTPKKPLKNASYQTLPNTGVDSVDSAD